jgi:hypothetical protein
VLYFLEGGGGSQRSGAWLVEKVERQIRAGALPSFIIVLPQALSDVGSSTAGMARARSKT